LKEEKILSEFSGKLDKVSIWIYLVDMLIQPKFHLQKRSSIDGVHIPFVTDIDRASELAHSFPMVVTAGPSEASVDWGHPNHAVESFHDVTAEMERSNPNWQAPTLDQIRRLVEFGASSNEEILVHCHAGISRSTATAIGISIARGLTLKKAVRAVSDAHPDYHPFYPNVTILSHIETIFDIRDGELRHYAGMQERY
jgi:predicted protein tyrosine phosphatase